ncbi:hypothetical protein GCM10023185_38340 [Hymenobacter saemangeumensis]|uniref:Uncharacterized protein n=1 Tax=Hymenobacter saemangeumensis TaxID=1084522 RepID=A0ABP8IQI8_9BACT
MSFNLKNIGAHPVSTLWGILFMAALLGFVFAGKATLADIQPYAVLVIPFLLYGRAGGPPAAGTSYDSTAAPDQLPTGAPGAGI